MYILSSGLIVVLSLPYDVFNVVFTKFTIPSSLNEFISFFPSVLNTYLAEPFQPFINLSQLTNSSFVEGTVNILLVSVAFGLLMYFLYEILKSLNQFVMAGRIQTSLNINDQRIEGEFKKWLLDNKSYDLNFMSATQMVATGLFYGAELFFFMNVLRTLWFFVSSYRYVGYSSMPLIFWDSLFWLGLSVLFGAVWYLFLLCNKLNKKRIYKNLIEEYRLRERRVVIDAPSLNKKVLKTRLLNEDFVYALTMGIVLCFSAIIFRVISNYEWILLLLFYYTPIIVGIMAKNFKRGMITCLLVSSLFIIMNVTVLPQESISFLDNLHVLLAFLTTSLTGIIINGLLGATGGFISSKMLENMRD